MIGKENVMIEKEKRLRMELKEDNTKYYELLRDLSLRRVIEILEKKKVVIKARNEYFDLHKKYSSRKEVWKIVLLSEGDPLTFHSLRSLMRKRVPVAKVIAYLYQKLSNNLHNIDIIKFL